MTTPKPNVVNMETAARLIREAKEAREKRKAMREMTAQEQTLVMRALLASSDPEKPQFPGRIDDLEV